MLPAAPDIFRKNNLFFKKKGNYCIPVYENGKDHQDRRQQLIMQHEWHLNPGQVYRRQIVT